MPRTKKALRITDVRIAVAKECLLYGDSSKDTITRITKAYLKQIKLDGFHIDHWRYEKKPTTTIVTTASNKATCLPILFWYILRASKSATPATTNKINLFILLFPKSKFILYNYMIKYFDEKTF